MSSFFCASEQKMANLTWVQLAPRRQKCQNGEFQTLLDFEKNRALLNLLKWFSKIIHYWLYFSKIKKISKFFEWPRIFDIYRNQLLKCLYHQNGFLLIRIERKKLFNKFFYRFCLKLLVPEL